MRKFKYLYLILILSFLAGTSLSAVAKDNKEGSRRRDLGKVAVDPQSSVINVNNITCWVGSDGFHDWVVAGSYNGAYPKGTVVGSIFAEGIVWGGQVNDGQSPALRVNGNTFGSGCRSILDNRVYRVRPDYAAGDLTEDAASFFSVALGAVNEGMVSELRAQYEKDWMEWPVSFGAPYFDADSNGIYEPDPNGNGILGEDREDIPGIPASSQTLFIAYNDDISATNYGSPPIGLEIRETYWAYSYTGALGNVIYKKVQLIYRGTPEAAASSTIRDFYFLQWADPDVGTSSDDFMGCDTTLNLGYAYNSTANDATYGGIGLAPAAVGYDFLQGVARFTGDPADSAIVNLQWRKGYRYVNSKPMSSAVFFAAGGLWSDPDFNYQGSIEFYNYMRGRLPGGDPFPAEVADEVPGIGTYLLAGDPVAGTGKIDGSYNTPGDRRLLVINGPINLNRGDTAEVVVALVGGLGSSNLESVRQMKQNDLTAQIVFDQLFQLPTLPPPTVQVTQLDNKIILNWGSDASSVNRIENFVSQGYTFEGYDIYMLRTSTSKVTDVGGENPGAIKIAQFDLENGITTILDTIATAGVLLPVITETGTDNGIQRFLEITRNPFLGNAPLRNGQEYYFAVVPYAYNPTPLLPFHALQSAAITRVGIPQSPAAGERFSSAFGDTITAVTHVGGSDGSVVPIVVDPTVATGAEYKVTFGNDATWSVTNNNTGTVVTSGQTNQSGGGNYPIVDGVMVQVFGPQPDFKDFLEVANANGPHEPTMATFTFNGSGFPSSFPADVDRPSPNPAGARWGIQTGNVDDASFSYEFFKGRVLRGTNGSRLIPYDYEIRFVPGKGEMAFTTENIVDVPFQLWNIGISTPDDPSDDFQMIPFINDVNENEQFDLDGVDHPISGGDNDAETDWIYWYEPADKTPGSAGYNAFLADKAVFGDEVMARMVLVNFNGGSVSDATFPANMNEQLPAPGTVFRLISTKPNAVNDVFTYTAPSKSTSADLAKADLELINAFPNPYYGFHYRETSRDDKYITFSHLPSRATIRIFDLSGVMVRTLNHNDANPATSQRTRWDLKNNDNYPVASGVYIVHIDMPEMGATKILKLAIVQEEQILKVY